MDTRLVGSEIHGFHTLQDLDVKNVMEEARTRWLRPNEIHAILCNHRFFDIKVRPVNLPASGTIVLFDRKMLRNFRKDGHNWKKKKDGKTVKEAHEHLKVGNEERIHVYYAHGQDNTTFVRRCYWLLDKALEHIVLVHYRETQELQGSPVTPVNSNSSTVSDHSTPLLVSEEFDSGVGNACRSSQNELLGSNDSFSVRNHEMTLHEINTLEWDDLVTDAPNNLNDLVTDAPNNLTVPKEGGISGFDQIAVNPSVFQGRSLPTGNISTTVSSFSNDIQFNTPESICSNTIEGQVNHAVQSIKSTNTGTLDSLNNLINDKLQSQDSFGQWMDSIMTDSPSELDEPVLESSISSNHTSFVSSAIDHQSPITEQIFSITDVSPMWAYSSESTKILVTGFFHDKYLNLEKTNLFCNCGDVAVPAEIIQVGVYRCLISPQSPGVVNIYLSLDSHKPISQVLNFEYRSPLLHEQVASSEYKANWEEFRLQMRLACLLFSKPKTLDILSGKVSPKALQEAKRFTQKTLSLSNSWTSLIKLIENNRTSFEVAKSSLFEITLRNRIKEWLLESIVAGSKTPERDDQGQGVIHLCAILGYSWVVHLFSWSGLSLDFRDKFGWTALHWAAYCGREKMVAILLTAGAKPNLITDPTPKNPGGCTAADLAYLNGYDGLAAYLSEKALVAHFKDMTIAGNASGTLQTESNDTANQENLTEDDICLKDSLAAYRTVADAAARIQSAFREHSLKVRTKAVQISNPEDEARNIIAAMKIQYAFRHYETKKRMAAAARIQYRFRTWKIRKDFLNMRHHAVRIQAAFRAFQARRQYRKILWSVGVLEKAVLRWRLKRKGFRGLQTTPVDAATDSNQGSGTEEDFFKTSRKQAEVRVERAVITVQSMFRSKKAQQEYRRMKLTYEEAKLEYEELLDPITDMER